MAIRKSKELSAMLGNRDDVKLGLTRPYYTLKFCSAIIQTTVEWLCTRRCIIFYQSTFGAILQKLWLRS